MKHKQLCGSQYSDRLWVRFIVWARFIFITSADRSSLVPGERAAGVYKQAILTYWNVSKNFVAIPCFSPSDKRYHLLFSSL